jgi:DNA-binding transcriptional LysR family regulator
MDYFAALRHFTRAAELGSFSKAADEQAAKISTISRHIRALEEDVGAALFNRSTRRLHLTEAGRALHARALVILADLDEARNATRELNSRPQGVLRVTVPGTFGRRHIMPHLAAFLRLYPDISLDMMVENRTIDLIEAGIDVAIRLGTLRDSSLIAKRLGPHERIPVASPACLAGHAAIERPEDMQRLHGMDFGPNSGLDWYCRPAGETPGAPRCVAMTGRIRINDLDALLLAAIDGLGVALLPRWLVADAIADGSLVALLPAWRWSIDNAAGDPAIWAVYPPKRIVSPKVRVFIDFVAQRSSGWVGPG